jgi:hypothetical protein
MALFDGYKRIFLTAVFMPARVSRVFCFIASVMVFSPVENDDPLFPQSDDDQFLSQTCSKIPCKNNNIASHNQAKEV